MFELSTTSSAGLPTSEPSKAHLGKKQTRTRAPMAATDFLAKCPGVSVKMLIELAWIKQRWHSLGSGDGGERSTEASHPNTAHQPPIRLN